MFSQTSPTKPAGSDLVILHQSGLSLPAYALNLVLQTLGLLSTSSQAQERFRDTLGRDVARANLINNAIEFTIEGEMVVRVW